MRTAFTSVLSSLVVCGLLGSACFPQLPVGTPGLRDHQAVAALALPGVVFNAAALNAHFAHAGLSIDTKLGAGKRFDRAYDSATRRWRASWEASFDGTTFVDPHGTAYDVTGLAPGAAIPGSTWVVVDADTVRTKGGLVFDFDAAGRLAAEHWSFAPFPRLAYAWSGDALEVEECVSDAQQQGGACRPLVRIAYGPHGPVQVVDRVSAAAGLERVAEYAYDAEGRLVQARTPRQRALDLPGTRYEYATARFVTAQILPDGERIEYVYAQTHLVQVRPRGEGDPLHRLDYTRTADGGWEVLYTAPLGGRTRYVVAPDSLPTRIERLDLAVPEAMTIDWHAGLLRPSRITAFDGSAHEYPAWVDDDPAVVVEPSGNVLAIEYAPHGMNFEEPLRRAVASLEDALGPVGSSAYDAAGLPVSRSNGEGETTTFAYLAGNRVQETSAWGDVTDFTSFGAAGHWRKASRAAMPEVVVRRAFDAVGNLRVAAAGLQRGGVLDGSWDRDRRLEGLRVAATDGDGRVTHEAAVDLDLRGDGRPRAIRRPLGADHELAYDALGRLVGVCERVLGACRDTLLEVDLEGRRTAIQRANGMREEFDYDAYGRVIAHRALRDGVLEGERTFVWERNRIVAASDSVRGETTSLAYDAAGRLASESHSTHGELRILDHDLRSRPVRETFVAPAAVAGGAPQTLVLGYEYDLADRPTRWFVDDGSPAGELLRERVIVDGRVVEVRDGNGTLRESLFDAQTGRPVGFRTSDAAGLAIEDSAFTSSLELAPARFQVRSRTTTALAVTEEEYWLNRPGSLLTPDGRVGMRVFRARGWDDGVLTHDRRYAWDALGNVADDATGNQFTYNADRTRLLAAAGVGLAHDYAYDAAGYVTRRDGLELAWTATGRVARVGPASMPLAQATWDLAGRLVSVETDDEWRAFDWFGGRVEGDASGGGPGWIHVGGISLPFAGAVRRYRHVDFRGNTSLVTDEAGTVVSHRRHHAFGLDRVHGSSGSGGASLLEQLVLSGFAGGVAAQGLGLGFTGARVLDFDTGRFLSPDPVLHVLNQVTYAVGNPILFQDRDGLHEVTTRDVVAAVGEVVVAGLNVLGSGILFATSVSVFNAAPTALVAVSGLAVVGSGVLLVGSLVGFGIAVSALVATQAALDAQGDRPVQEKQLDLRPGATGLEALPGLGLSSGLVGPDRGRTPGGLGLPELSTASPPTGACAALGPPGSRDLAVWLQAVCTFALLSWLITTRQENRRVQ